MKVKTSELTDAALDWAVAKAKNLIFAKAHGPGTVIFDAVWTHPEPTGRQTAYVLRKSYEFWAAKCDSPILGGKRLWLPSTDWSLGGPIIDREDIDVLRDTETVFGAKLARTAKHPQRDVLSYFVQRGPTKLTAAMRCYVASKLGDEVEIPDELLKEQP